MLGKNSVGFFVIAGYFHFSEFMSTTMYCLCPSTKGRPASTVVTMHACGVYNNIARSMHVVFTYHMSLVDSSMQPAALLAGCINPPLLPLYVHVRY
jgi:hypothetical protein